jgi:hypothetical protein
MMHAFMHDLTNDARMLLLLLLLQEYVLEQMRQFAVEFAQQLAPQVTHQDLDLAFSRALYAVSAHSSQKAIKIQLRFTHKCK